MFNAPLKVYVIHYTRFSERRTHMETVLRERGLDQFPVRWVTEHDREELLQDHGLGKWGNPKEIAAASVSLILKHFLAYKLAAEDPGSWHLILEDDVIVKPGLLENLAKLLPQLPTDWELFFVGTGCDLHVPIWERRPGKRIYFRGWKPRWWAGAGCSRCTEAYLVNPRFASRFLATKFAQPPFSHPIDWLLNHAGYELHTRSYWAEPPLISQGAFESWTKNPELNSLKKQ